MFANVELVGGGASLLDTYDVHSEVMELLLEARNVAGGVEPEDSIGPEFLGVAGADVGGGNTHRDARALQLSFGRRTLSGLIEGEEMCREPDHRRRDAGSAV